MSRSTILTIICFIAGLAFGCLVIRIARSAEPDPLAGLGNEFHMAAPSFVAEHEEKIRTKFLWERCLPPYKGTEFSLVQTSNGVQYKVKETITPGLIARTLTWESDDATGKMIGERDWHVGDEYLYVAVSIDELRPIRYDIYEGKMPGWPWMNAFEKGILKSVWYSPCKQPFYALRMDYFARFKKEIDAVHKGDLPWSITRDDKDDD